MNTSTTLIAMATLSLAAAAQAGPVLLTEGFDNVASLNGWLLANQSAPPGLAWFQGNDGIFAAQAGAPDAYIGADFLSALNGAGAIDNWLITPVIHLAGPATISFYTRTLPAPGFNDTLQLLFNLGASGVPSAFTSVLATIGGPAAYPGDWTRYSATVTGNGSGRFAFRYTGDAAMANYVGLDTVSVTAADVPEPATLAMFAFGVAALVRARRKCA